MRNRRHSLFLLLFMLLIGCNSRNTSEVATNSKAPSSGDLEIQRYNDKAMKDSLLLSMTAEILEVIKEKDFPRLVEYFHPELGLRFSPYGYIDTVHHVRFTAEEFIKQSEDGGSISWGSYDGTGKDIQMSLEDYFNKFVYEVDFLNAEQISVNEVLGK